MRPIDYLINYIEKLTHTDMRYLIKGGGWLGANQIALNLLGFLLSIVFANAVAKEVFGSYRGYLSIETVVTAFMLGGMGTALSRAVAQGHGGVLARATRVTLTWNGLVGVVVACIGIYNILTNNINQGIAFILIGATAPLIETYKLYAWYVQGKKLFHFSSISGVIQEGGPIIAVMIALFFTHRGLILALIFLFTQVFIVLGLYLYTRAHYVIREPEEPEAIRYGIQLSALNVLNIISTQIDRIVLFALLGPVAVAVYTFAIAVPDRLKGLCRIVGTIALPKFSARSYEDIQATLPYRLFIMALVVGVVGIAYALAAPLIFHLLFPKYVEAIGLSQLASLVLIGSLVAVPTAAFNAHKKVREQAALGIICPIFEIVATIVMGRAWGIVGVLWAQIISYAVMFTLYLFFLRFDQAWLRWPHRAHHQ